MASTHDAPGNRQLWLIAGNGNTRTERVADVALLRPVFDVRAYAVPAELAATVRPGVLVEAPAGRSARPVTGWCVRVSEQPWKQTRPVLIRVAQPRSLFTPALIELGLWISEYYACFPGKTLSALAPAGVRKAGHKLVPCVRLAAPAAAAPESRLTAGQRRLLEVLAAGELPRAEALRRANVRPPTLATLRRRGLVEVRQRAEPAPRESSDDASAGREAPPEMPEPCAEDDLALTPGQLDAIDAIAATIEPAAFAVHLLFGVPGSGKTEVYVRAVRRALAAGRQAIVLVPEIALATQVLQRLARRFEHVAVLHSRLTERQRRETWARITAGAADVVIGTRTAVFAPCPRLGLIVVDEEQERSFKNLASPLYHARDVAIKRGQIEGVPVVLGSATPSLETWHNAHTLGHYRLLRLAERVPGARLPTPRVALMGQGDRAQPSRLLSMELVRALEETLADRQQAVLLHNRRGYAVHLRCQRCGMTPRCERCGTALVHHRPEALLKCHRCGRRMEARTTCLDDSCRGALEQAGLAIQRLEEELRAVLPGARLLRLDSDTMRRREDYAAALRRFETGDADVLLGTQMIAKGLDFPRVRLVGVIDADGGLDLPDFRAAEHTFQLLVQVVGRAGRRAGVSLALVQCREVSPVMRSALALDFEGFAAREIAWRERLGYPPAGRLARLIASDARPARARQTCETLAERLGRLAGRVHPLIRVVSSGPCLVQRLRGRFRYDVLLSGPPGGALQRLLREAAREKLLFGRAERLVVDVDPVEMR